MSRYFDISGVRRQRPEAMEFREVVRRRRMVRSYAPEPVPRDALERILDHARRAPSAGFSQGQRFVVVTDEDRRRALADALGEEDYVARGFDAWVSAAPVLIVPCVREDDYHERYREPDKKGSDSQAWPVPFWWIDAGAALMLLLLAVVDEGLAAGFLGIRDPQRVKDLLGIPADVTPLGVVTVGHPAPDRRSGSLRRGRRPLDEVVRFEHW